MPWIPRAHRTELGELSKNLVNPIINDNVSPALKVRRGAHLIHSILAHHDRATTFLNRHSIALLRVALGVVFIWFGALKLTGATPVTELVLRSVPFIAPPAWLVPALGVFEVAIGLCLLLGAALAVVLPLFVGHMVATFSVLVTQPDIAFIDHDPLMLTVVGEFVVKNLVLLAAGIAVCTWRAVVASPEPAPAPVPEEA